MSISDSLRYAAGLLLSLALILGAVFAINYAADPLWIWGNAGRVTQLRAQVDTRLQKVNLALRSPAKPYQALLIGSSRTAGYSFAAPGALNFSVNTMLPAEYADAVETAQTINGTAFKRIYLGLDFFTSAADYRPLYPPFNQYLARSRSPWYRLKATISLRSLQYSIATIQASVRNDRSGCLPCYDTRYLFVLPHLSGAEHAELLARQYKTFSTRQYATAFRESPDFAARLDAVSAHNQGAQITAFITPEHIRLHRLLASNGLAEEYRAFVRTAVSRFGRVIVFDPGAPMSRDLGSFYDLHHPTRATASKISACIAASVDCDPSLGAASITSANVDDYLREWGLAVTTPDRSQHAASVIPRN